MPTRLAVLSFAAALAITPALAQSGTSRTATVEKGKQIRLAVITALKNDCKIGVVGSVRIITPPKNGQLAIRTGNIKTPATFRCPNVETPVQGLFYQSRPNFSGIDEVSYEARNSDGATQTFTVKITVTDKPGGGGSKGGLQEL